MAVTTPVAGGQGAASAAAVAPARGETALRLAGAQLLTLALTLFVAGAAWDIQWHPSVGRDRVLSSPHVLLLAGMALSGLLSLALILIDSWRARRGPAVGQHNSTLVLGVFHAPIGLYLAGVGALLGTLAFPLDDYWHTLYGIDVTLWAPFHIMIISSMVLAGAGALFTIASELNRLPAGGARRWAELSFLAALAATFAALLLPLAQANTKEGLATIAGTQVALYPVLLALALPLALLTAARVSPMPGSATLMALGFLAIRQALVAFVPWAMRWAVAAEGYSYRAGAPNEVITPFAYPVAIVGAAVLVDLMAWLVRARPAWRDRALAAAAALGSVLVTLWDKPWAGWLDYYFPTLDMRALAWQSLPPTIVAAALGSLAALLFSRSLLATRQ